MASRTKKDQSSEYDNINSFKEMAEYVDNRFDRQAVVVRWALGIAVGVFLSVGGALYANIESEKAALTIHVADRELHLSEPERTALRDDINDLKKLIQRLDDRLERRYPLNNNTRER